MAFGGDLHVVSPESRELCNSYNSQFVSPPDLLHPVAVKDRKPNTMMFIGPDRVVYAGLLGQPVARSLGALTIYVSIGSPFSIRIDGGPWESAEIKVVPPDVPHTIVSGNRMIGSVMIEPESVDAARLPAFLQFPYPAQGNGFFERRVRAAFACLTEEGGQAALLRTDVDQLLFGQELPKRQLDGRMATVIERIKKHPCDLLGAEDYALMVGLSFSRFLHLFKEQVGTTFRSFRAWRRARTFLAYVQADLNLTDIALETGYPDSSHFSHTVRRYWGLKPKDIIAGSRRLAIISQGDGLGMAAGR